MYLTLGGHAEVNIMYLCVPSKRYIYPNRNVIVSIDGTVLEIVPNISVFELISIDVTVFATPQRDNNCAEEIIDLVYTEGTNFAT